jgi:hypothetical protein
MISRKKGAVEGVGKIDDDEGADWDSWALSRRRSFGDHDDTNKNQQGDNEDEEELAVLVVVQDEYKKQADIMGSCSYYTRIKTQDDE